MRCVWIVFAFLDIVRASIVVERLKSIQSVGMAYFNCLKIDDMFFLFVIFSLLDFCNYGFFSVKPNIFFMCFFFLERFYFF